MSLTARSHVWSLDAAHLHDRAKSGWRCAVRRNSLRATFFASAGFAKVFTRLKRRSGLRGFSARVLRHTWATNFMKADGANLLERKRQGGWERWEMVERNSHAIPVKDRRSLPNPLESTQRTAFGQQPSARISRLRAIG